MYVCLKHMPSAPSLVCSHRKHLLNWLISPQVMSQYSIAPFVLREDCGIITDQLAIGEYLWLSINPDKVEQSHIPVGEQVNKHNGSVIKKEEVLSIPKLLVAQVWGCSGKAEN